MERDIESAHKSLAEKARHDAQGDQPRTGQAGFAAMFAPPDKTSVICAFLGGLGFFALGIFCLTLSRFDAALASVWLPNAAAVALLLLVRPRNGAITIAGFAIASFAANASSGLALGDAAIFTLANLLDIALVTWLTRWSCKGRPVMTDLAHLGRFLLYGGLVGPACSALLAGSLSSTSLADILGMMSSWFLADSMGMILTVPAALLIAEAVRNREVLSNAELGERILLMSAGMAGVILVFEQNDYPLLFLVPPVTLLVAFRLGGLGTALYVPSVAVVASWMTHNGIGPIAANAASDLSQIYVTQAFVAANFLTGLPIAAILAGRARLTRELIEGRSELALLAENVTDAVLRVDDLGEVTYASSSVREVLGCEPHDLIGRAVTDNSHNDTADRFGAVIERLLEGDCDKERITYRRALEAEDRTPIFIEADCAVATDPVSGKRSGIVVSARDVTERVELELLLTRARRNAENAAHAKSEFLANMSHEIRTPMNGVLGFAELMLQGDLPAEDRRHTEMIVQSARSMMLLLNDILDLSKIEAGQIAIDRSPVDINATIAECAALHRPTAEKKGLKLNFATHDAACDDCNPVCATCIDQMSPVWLMSDALRLRQIVLNLIGNAVKFTEHGGVEVRFEVMQDELCVEVSDTGIGISRSRLETIFAPFMQAETDTARRYGGTGLGLSISRQLAELLGGQITVESEPGIGSTFRLLLPAVKAQPANSLPIEAGSIAACDLPQSASILLVEDHDVNRLLGVEMLERCGQSVDTAHDGNEAIAMVIDSILRAKPYDLVLMDIQMPGCDGYAATRAIRGEGIGPEVLPIIALTANAFPEDIAAARDAGMQAHLAKPLVFGDLARALQRWLPTRIIESDGASQRLSDTGAEYLEPPQTHAKPAEGRNGGMLHSPALVKRWARRRREAIEAVRHALETGLFGDATDRDEEIGELTRTVHKLAGTAAIFGEPELGDQAAAFERSLRQNLPCDVRGQLAFKLLSVADDPADTLMLTGS